MWQDPIVAEVRRIRDAHIEQYHGDLRAIYLALKQEEAMNPQRKVSFPPKRVEPIVVKKLQPEPA